MALSNAYATVAELQGHVNTDTSATWTNLDINNMTSVIQSVSEWLDSKFNTTFYARTETRVYTADMDDMLYIDDLLSITTLKTDTTDDGTYDTTWTTADYWLEPTNNDLGRKPRPYRQIRVNYNGSNSFPSGVQRGVQIAGSWGYCTEANRPAVIKQITLLASHRIWKRKDAIFGVAGTAALGVTTVIAQVMSDGDIQLLLTGIDRRAIYYV